MNNLFDSKIISIEQDFFSQQEIGSMLLLIKEHDALIEKFVQVKPVPIKAAVSAEVYFGFFGAAAYFFTNNYKSCGDLTRSVLLKHINYNKILAAITKFTGMKASLSAVLNPPGFHLFVNNSEEKVNISVKNWHHDKLFDKAVCSFLVPISLPAFNAGLDFYNKQNEIERINYKLNCLYGWHSSTIHTISDMELLSGESRITLQMHCLKTPNKNELTVFW
jgi:hypothetical protein